MELSGLFFTIPHVMSSIQHFSTEKGSRCWTWRIYIHSNVKTRCENNFRCQNRGCSGKRYYNNDSYLLLYYSGCCCTDPTMEPIQFGPTGYCHSLNLDMAPVLELKNQIKTQSTHREEASSTDFNSVMISFPLCRLCQSNAKERNTCE
jgi:hypothetical protein